MSAVLLGSVIDFWKSCMFLGGTLRALRDLSGGLARFLPGEVDANHCRLRRVGQCGHGFTCRSRVSSSVGVLDERPSLLGGELNIWSLDAALEVATCWRVCCIGD